MDPGQFSASVDRYKTLVVDLPKSDKWISMDWDSEIFLDGWRKCLGIIEEYVKPASRVLDFGCGTGMMSVLLHEMGYEAKGIDIDVGSQPEAVADTYTVPWGSCVVETENPAFMSSRWERVSVQYGVSLTRFDGKHIPFEDGSMDAVVAHAVLEHVSPDCLDTVLEEIDRVLVPGGFFLVLRTPRRRSYMEALSRLLRVGAHDILYSEEEMANRVSAHGFRLVRKEVMDMLPAFLPFGMRLYNAVSPLLIRLDRLLLRTPLKKFAHHMALVFVKV